MIVKPHDTRTVRLVKVIRYVALHVLQVTIFERKYVPKTYVCLRKWE